ncbi:hypothetical protein LABALGNA3A7_09760 [Dellaglioa algida]|nr:hypothetical protein LABALGNA3A7_09760 [Dellaglioa algida]
MAAKEQLEKSNKFIIQKLSKFDENIKVYADSIAEDEQDIAGMNYLLFSTSDFSNPESDSIAYSMTQNIYVTFVSEKRPFIDGDIIDIIRLLRESNLVVTLVEKDHRQLEKQDRYVDIVVFECRRLVKIGC